MAPQVQPKCFWHAQHMTTDNWKKWDYLIRFGHTEALLKKKGQKQPKFPLCRNWPIWTLDKCKTWFGRPRVLDVFYKSNFIGTHFFLQNLLPSLPPPPHSKGLKIFGCLVSQVHFPPPIWKGVHVPVKVLRACLKLNPSCMKLILHLVQFINMLV